MSTSDQGGEKKMQVQANEGDVFVDALGWYDGEVIIEENGWGNFKSNNQSVSIWVPKSAKAQCGL